MTYEMLYQILIEAEARIKEFSGDIPAIAERSQETVNLCNEAMAKEGITREQLKKLAGF